MIYFKWSLQVWSHANILGVSMEMFICGGLLLVSWFFSQALKMQHMTLGHWENTRYEWQLLICFRKVPKIVCVLKRMMDNQIWASNIVHMFMSCLSGHTYIECGLWCWECFPRSVYLQNAKHIGSTWHRHHTISSGMYTVYRSSQDWG